MNGQNQNAQFEMRPLSFIRDRHKVRRINQAYVEHLANTMKQIGIKDFPIDVTPDGILFGGNHRYEAFLILGVTECWMRIYMPASLTREAVELNVATEEHLPSAFVDNAELVWWMTKQGQTQAQVAQELGWSANIVIRYSHLGKICKEAWDAVVANHLPTFQGVGKNDNECVGKSNLPSGNFTENLLRDIIPLTPGQQLELVTDLASNKIQKNRFTKLAKDYRARNEMDAWMQAQLSGTDMVGRAMAEIAKGIYDAEWQATKGPGPKLEQLVQVLRDEWERKHSVTLIHGDFYEKVQEVGDGSVDLILTDPPYNVANERVFKLAGRTDISQNFGEWDKYEHAAFIALFDDWAREFNRILVGNGSGYVFTSDHYISHLREALERAGLNFRATLVWHRKNPGTQVVKTNFKSSVEYILFFTKGESGHTFNWQGEMEMHNFIETPICGGSERLLDAKKNTLHPTQKPLAVLQHLMEISIHPGDMVFDGFMGVGSTARAARDLGRKFIGMEQDATFFEAAQRRMNDA